MNAVLSHARLDRSVPLLRRLSACGQSLRAIAALWRMRWRERTEFGAMTNAELRDAGLTPYDARREARKPVWRA